MRRDGERHLLPYRVRRAAARYYLLAGSNVGGVKGGEYAYLDHESGEWVPHQRVFNMVTGCGGDSDTVEISELQARDWIRENVSEIDFRLIDM